MSTQFTTNVNAPYPQQGIDVLWGTTLNFMIVTYDLRWGSTFPQTLSNVSPVVFPTSSVAGTYVPTQYNCIQFNGVLTADIIVQFPPGVGGAWFIENFTTGAHTVTLQVGSGPSGTTYHPPQGFRSYVRSDGTNMDAAANAPFWVVGPTIPNNTIIANTTGSTARPSPVDPSTLKFTLGLDMDGGTLDMDGGTIINLATPVNPTDGVNKSYVDGLAAGIKFEPSAQKLLIVNNTGTPNTKLDVSVNSVQMVTAVNGQILRGSTSVTIDGTVNGVNGLDTGSLIANTFYHIYLIDNGTTTAGLLSLSSTSPTLPGGYTYLMRMGATFTDVSVHFSPRNQLGPNSTAVASTTYPVIFTGTTISNNVVSIASAKPSTATNIYLGWKVTGTGIMDALYYPDSANIAEVLVDLSVPIARTIWNYPIQSNSVRVNITVVASGSPTGTLYCIGWTDSVNAT